MDDWRLTGQERYLQGVVLQYRPWRQPRPSWDHDHCAFCNAKFAALEGCLKHAYSTLDEYHWICDQCFADFRARFAWKVIH
jgi:hypothetical protein